MKTGLTVVAAILGVMALKAIYFRSACKEWPLEVAKEKQNLQNATRTISLRQEEYNARAKLNCDWYFRNIKRKEVYSFCKTGYPMTHIPLVWHLPSEHSPDKVCLFPPGPLLDIPEVRLTCHAHEVLKARLHANEIQSRLEFIKARPPSFVSYMYEGNHDKNKPLAYGKSTMETI